MDFHFYQENCSEILDLFVEQLTEKGANVQIHECLCKHNLEEKLPSEVFCHPADYSVECLQQVWNVVAANPYTNFYIFAAGRPKRKEIIGRHKNLTYLELGNAGYKLHSLIKREERN